MRIESTEFASYSHLTLRVGLFSLAALGVVSALGYLFREKAPITPAATNPATNKAPASRPFVPRTNQIRVMPPHFSYARPSLLNIIKELAHRTKTPTYMSKQMRMGIDLLNDSKKADANLEKQLREYRRLFLIAPRA